jgi:triosephosphate isomerase
VSALANVTSDEIEDLVIAYEPVWAISNGKDFEHHLVPTTQDIKNAAAEIRKQVEALYGKKAAEGLRVLYGASVTPDNAHAFVSVKGIDGLLVGGASLNYQHFSGIVAAAHRKKHGLMHRGI